LSTTSAIIKVSVLPNKAPVVSITNPLNNAVYTAGATINISASASDADGTIKSVKFYRGTTLLKTDSISPYTYSWTNASAGTYSLTAKATDNRGLSTTSPIVSISVVAKTTIVSSKPSSSDDLADVNYPVSMNLYPNPASNTLI
jgi:chitodextrinase